MLSLESNTEIQIVHGACKFRLYPTEEQKVFFAKQFGCCRFVYNHLLIRMGKAYRRRKESVSTYQAKRLLVSLKQIRRYSFLKEVNSQSLQSAVLNLGKARDKFFSKQGGYPKLKSKGGRQSFEVPQNFLLKKSKRGNVYLYIPKIKSAIKIKAHREVPGEIKHVIISMEPDGKYYASINYREEKPSIAMCGPVDINLVRGFDLGLVHLYKDDMGNEQQVQKYYKKAEKKIAKSKKNISRKKKGGKNREKARVKSAKRQCKVKNQRKDFIHKQSYKIVNENQVICFETLNVKWMMQNHCLAKSVTDAMLGELIRQVKYKAKWRNKKFIQIGRFEPSSKLCSNCGAINKSLKLHHRTWVCDVCHVSHDRDVNAAINIKKIGQVMSESTSAERTTSEKLLSRSVLSCLDMKEAESIS